MLYYLNNVLDLTFYLTAMCYKVNIKDFFYTIPLIEALKNNNMEIFYLLLSRPEIDVNLKCVLDYLI